MSVTFVIPDQSVAKGRPKFARHGKAVLAYTPAKTASYENLVKLAANAAMSGALGLNDARFDPVTLRRDYGSKLGAVRIELGSARMVVAL